MIRKGRAATMEELRGRVAALEAEIQQWGRDSDETATLAKFPPATVRTFRGVGRAEEQIEKAKRELANGNLPGASWHLDQAQAIRLMQRVTVLTVAPILHAAEEGRKVARGRASGGDTTAQERKRERAGRDAKLIAALKNILSDGIERSNADLAELLAERLGRGKAAIVKKMPELLNRLKK